MIETIPFLGNTPITSLVGRLTARNVNCISTSRGRFYDSVFPFPFYIYDDGFYLSILKSGLPFCVSLYGFQNKLRPESNDKDIKIRGITINTPANM